MNKKRKKKRFRLITIIGSILLVFIILLIIAASHIGERMAEGYLRKFLATSPLKGHIITFEDIDVNVATLSIAAYNVLIYPDTTSPLISNPDSLAMMKTYYIRAEKLAVKRIRVWEMLKSKTAHVGLLYLKRPEVHFVVPNEKVLKQYGLMDAYMPLTAKAGVPAPPPVEFVEAEVFEIYEGSIKISERGIRKPLMHTRSYSIKIWDASFNPTDTSGFQNSVQYDDIRFDARGLSVSLQKGYYDFYVGELSMDYEERWASIDTFRLIPRYNKKDFGYKVGSQGDRLDIMVEHIELNDVRTAEMIKDMGINIREIDISGAHFSLYRDKNIPLDRSRFPKYLSQAILSMDIPLRIDSIFVEDSYLQYEELGEGKPETGIIILDDMNAKVTNMTNDPAVIADHGSMIFQAGAMFYGKGKLDLTLSFSLKDMNGNFDFSGTIGPMKMAEFNPFITPVMKMIIHDGQMNKVIFRAAADQSGARGTMRFLYQDLNVVVLKKKQDAERKKASFFFTDLANIAVRKHNPPKNKPDRVAMMEFDRDPNKNFIGLMVRTLLDGIAITLLPGQKNIVAEGMENEQNIDEIMSKSEVKAEEKEKKKKGK